jgi:hypothetical protein
MDEFAIVERRAAWLFNMVDASDRGPLCDAGSLPKASTTLPRGESDE